MQHSTTNVRPWVATVLQVLCGLCLLATVAMPLYWIGAGDLSWADVRKGVGEMERLFGNRIPPSLLLGLAVFVPSLGLFLIAQGLLRAGRRGRSEQCVR